LVRRYLQAFQYREDAAIPVAAFGAWQGLLRAASAAGLLRSKARLLAQPLQHALVANSRPETLQVCHNIPVL
jgi:spore maturation protein SpmA